jgi:bifunctional non-homologous end joining protein LigD
VTKARQAAAQLAASPPAGFLPLQHPRNVQYPPTGDDWRHEIKLDGYRMQLRVAGQGASWYSRNGNDWTARLPDFAPSAMALGEGTFDGELCALKGDGAPDFSALRSYMGNRQTGRIMGDLTFIVFDLLADDSGDLRGKPLKARRERLETMLATSPPIFALPAPCRGMTAARSSMQPAGSAWRASSPSG